MSNKRANNDDMNKDNFLDKQESPEEDKARQQFQAADPSVLEGRKMAVPRKRANISGGAGGRPDGAPLFKGFGNMSSLPPPPAASKEGAPKSAFAGLAPSFGGAPSAPSFGFGTTPVEPAASSFGAGAKASPFGKPATNSSPTVFAGFGQKSSESAAPAASTVTFGGPSKSALSGGPSSESASQSTFPPAAKPGSPFAFGSSTSDTAPNSKVPIAFGSQAPSTNAFSSSGGFKFGAKPSEDSARTGSVPPPFQFGTPASTSATAPPAPGLALPSPFGAGMPQISQNPFAKPNTQQDSEEEDVDGEEEDIEDDGDDQDEPESGAVAAPMGFASTVSSAVKKEDGPRVEEKKPSAPMFSFKGSVPAKSAFPSSTAEPKFAGFGLPPPKANVSNGLQTPPPASDNVDTDKPSDQFLADVYALNQELLSRIKEVAPDVVVDLTPLCESYCKQYKELQTADKSSAKSPPTEAIAAPPIFASTSPAPAQANSRTSFFTNAAATPMLHPNMPKAFASSVAPLQTAKAPASAPVDDNEPSDAMPPEVTEDGEGPGEEDETNLFWAICKLYQIEDGKPTPHGVGTIRLNRFHKGPSEGRHRILYRDQSVIRELRLNLFLFPLLSPKLRGPKDVGMSFLQDQNGQKALQNYIVKFRDGASAEKFVKLIEENRGSD